jgi:hypothetical protein
MLTWNALIAAQILGNQKGPLATSESHWQGRGGKAQHRNYLTGSATIFRQCQTVVELINFKKAAYSQNWRQVVGWLTASNTSTLHIHPEFEGFPLLSSIVSGLLERLLNVSSVGRVLNYMEAFRMSSHSGDLKQPVWVSYKYGARSPPSCDKVVPSRRYARGLVDSLPPSESPMNDKQPKINVKSEKWAIALEG